MKANNSIKWPMLSLLATSVVTGEIISNEAASNWSSLMGFNRLSQIALRSPSRKLVAAIPYV
jgi:hypothetical protein